ncbi:glycosyltransferase [Palleronia abyssalis]|nr:glycosyltransferase [Palleronia abyssalis]
MQIVHVITSLNIGGAQIMLRRFLQADTQGGRRHRVVSLMPSGRIRRELEDAGVEVIDLRMNGQKGLPRALLQLRYLLRVDAPDVVHGWMYHGCLVAALTCPRRVPMVFGIHHSLQDPLTESRGTRVILRALAALSGHSAAVAYCGRSIAEQHEAAGFAESRRVVIPNGIDCEHFRPDPQARARLLTLCDIPAGRIVIGNVSRNHPMKDVGLLVRALKRALEDGVDAHLVVMGEGQEYGPAAKARDTLGLADRVTVLPVRADVERLVPGFDIFALSSAWGEAFSLAMAEAMAAGVPCISTSVGDALWLVGDRDRLVPPGDDRAMATALSRLARMTSEARTALGATDRERILKNFSLSSYVAAHARLYERVCATPRSTPKAARGPSLAER